MAAPTFTHAGNVLLVTGDLDWPIGVEFDIQTQKLLAAAKAHSYKDIIIDLRQVSHMGSQYLGALAAVGAEASKLGGYLTVRAGGHIAQLIAETGIDRLVTLETS